MSSLFEEYANSQNYYEKISSQQGTDTIVTETYTNNGKSLIITKTYSPNSPTKTMTDYYEDNTYNRYTENGETRFAFLNNIGNKKKIENPYNLYNSKKIYKLLTTIIKNVTYNEKQCYLIQNNKTNKFYIDQSTGLLVATIDGQLVENNQSSDILKNYIYEFNNITNDDIIEPNVDNYIIKKK